MTRLLAILAGIAGALAGSYFAFAAIQAVGPEDLSNTYGWGEAADTPPNGGNLFQAVNFARVKTALERELGKDAVVQSMTVYPDRANAAGEVDGIRVDVDIDASGRSQQRVGDKADPSAVVPLSKLDAAAVEKAVVDAGQLAGVDVEYMSLSPSSREWRLDMLDGGEMDTLVANLNGSGVRLSGEPNPEPISAGEDSLLREANLEKIFRAVAKETSPDAEVYRLDMRPDRVDIEVAQGQRSLALTYSFDTRLTGRTVQPATGTDRPSVKLSKLDPAAPERMAKAAKKQVKSKGLDDVQYVLLDITSNEDQPTLYMYLATGFDPPYVVSDLRGRGELGWPGKPIEPPNN